MVGTPDIPRISEQAQEAASWPFLQLLHFSCSLESELTPVRRPGVSCQVL